VASTSRQVGATLGVAIVGAAAGGGVTAALGKGFATATHPGWWIITGLGAVVLVLGVVTTSQWANETAVQTADRFREEYRVGGESAASAPG
jgi:hypothetical protein